jgi:uracil permease
MIQKVDLAPNKTLFVVSVILIAGVGGMSMSFGKVKLTEVACALILGIVTNLILSRKKDDAPVEKIEAPVEEAVAETASEAVEAADAE